MTHTNSDTPTESHFSPRRITLAGLRQMKQRGEKFAMLTAYDYPTARAAQVAGVHSLLVGDSMGMVVLGHSSTREIPLSALLLVAEAVRRGAPSPFLIGDMPFEAMASGDSAVLAAAHAFLTAGCDAVKIECEPHHAELIGKVSRAGIPAIAHLGLRPQAVTTSDGYRAQARDDAGLRELVAIARRMEQAGASMLLIEAVPPEAAEAVCRAVSILVVGCGAGPSCDGHVVVTHDMLGLGPAKPPKFVPVLADLNGAIESAMKRYVAAIAGGEYPGPQHSYSMRSITHGANR
ncbi:MAG: 3-methyl-2-oxobutanoate hydroxymethyltransferase [Phycisphaerales bacterium]|nr:3-methyl-2-oxobutanoate hydroxymethyltransferase [Phycisphaerales bacterium]